MMPDNPRLFSPDFMDLGHRGLVPGTSTSITLRDLFAAIALLTVMQSYKGSVEGAAKIAYAAADFMLAEREKKGGA